MISSPLSFKHTFPVCFQWRAAVLIKSAPVNPLLSTWQHKQTNTLYNEQLMEDKHFYLRTTRSVTDQSDSCLLFPSRPALPCSVSVLTSAPSLSTSTQHNAFCTQVFLRSRKVLAKLDETKAELRNLLERDKHFTTCVKTHQTVCLRGRYQLDELNVALESQHHPT